MPARRDPNNKKLWIFRKKMAHHPVTGEKVDISGGGYKSEGEALAAEAAELKKLDAPAPGDMPTFDTWFLGRFWTEWVIGGPRGANSPGEQESKQLIYGKHIKPFFGMLPLDRIDVERINTFRARLRGMLNAEGERLLSEKTLNNILAVLSTPLQYAVKAGILSRAPHVGVAKVERPEIEFIEFEEVPLLYDAACADMHQWTRIAFLLAYEAGMRIGEIRALQWPSVDMKGRTITVLQQMRTVRRDWSTSAGPAPLKYTDVTGKPKGRTRRAIRMSPALWEALRDRVRTGYVVSADGGKPVTKEMVRCAMERTAKAAGLSDRVSGWHVGRHTFGTHLALLGVNPWVLQEWMGHKDPMETQRYADVARAHGRAIPPELFAAGADELDPSHRALVRLSARLTLARAKDFGTAAGQKTNPPLKNR